MLFFYAKVNLHGWKPWLSAHGISLLQQLLIMAPHSLGFELENFRISFGTVQQCWGKAWICLCAASEQGGQGSGLHSAHCVNISWKHPVGQITGFSGGGKKVAGSNSSGCLYSWSLGVTHLHPYLFSLWLFPWQYLRDARRQWWLCDANQSCQV